MCLRRLLLLQEKVGPTIREQPYATLSAVFAGTLTVLSRKWLHQRRVGYLYVGAPHPRDRRIFLAHTFVAVMGEEHARLQPRNENTDSGGSGSSGAGSKSGIRSGGGG